MITEPRYKARESYPGALYRNDIVDQRDGTVILALVPGGPLLFETVEALNKAYELGRVTHEFDATGNAVYCAVCGFSEPAGNHPYGEKQ